MALTLIGGGWDDLGKMIFRGTLLSLGVLLGGLIWASAVDPVQPEAIENIQGAPPAVETKSSSNQIALAKHLQAKGFVMYSAYWCPHCHDQKEMFGKEASKELVIIECAEDGIDSQRELCLSKGIEGFPSWEINGKIESGVKSLKELSRQSGY